MQTDECREITHFQFVSWPDYGVPQSAESFLTFMQHVRRVQAERTRQLGDAWHGHSNGPPITIHCSAGIGRTGEEARRGGVGEGGRQCAATSSR